MIAARAVVTELGGSTSHAAVVTRALGRPCVVGVGPGTTADWIGREVTVDAGAGVVYAGRLPTQAVRVEDDPGLSRLLAWAREACPVHVGAPDGPGTRHLDEVGLGLDPANPPDRDTVASALQGATGASGAVLATPAGAEALLQAGVPSVTLAPAQHELVVLLALVHARLRRQVAGDTA